MAFNILRRKEKNTYWLIEVINHRWKINLKNQTKVAGNHPIEPVKENLSEPEILIDRLEY